MVQHIRATPFLVVCAILIAGLVAAKDDQGQSNYTVTEEAFLDIEIKDYDGPGDDLRGRIVIGLFGDTAPMTCMNFAKICEGFKMSGRQKLHYKNTYAHSIIKDFTVQFGDIVAGDGTGSRSIYGDKFIDENYIISHRSMGIVSMANHGKDTNGSQFFILLVRSRWLDNKNVAFGKVVKGMDLINAMNDLGPKKDSRWPKKTIKIVDSGVVGLDNKYELTEEQIDSEEDVLE